MLLTRSVAHIFKPVVTIVQLVYNQFKLLICKHNHKTLVRKLEFLIDLVLVDNNAAVFYATLTKS